jgi:hypothetical protein
VRDIAALLETKKYVPVWFLLTSADDSKTSVKILEELYVDLALLPIFLVPYVY